MHEEIAKQVIERNPKNLLDIACGPGDFLSYLADLDLNINLNGTDIAPEMVRHASQKLSTKAKILESKGEKQPFPENSFDVITIMLAFHHFPKKLETLQQIKKLLRLNGLFIIGDVVAKSRLQKKIWNCLERIISIRGYIGHYTENDIKELAKKAGFSVSIEYIPDMPKRYRICKFALEKTL